MSNIPIINIPLVFIYLAIWSSVLHAGKDKFTVTWALNNKSLLVITANSYKTVKVQLCYAPISQKERGWRKTQDDLKKDKTCQFDVVELPYASPGTYEYTVEEEIPSAYYFVRAYVLDASEKKVQNLLILLAL